MKPPTRQTERHVEAVLAALDVLECFLDRPALSMKEIIQRTRLTRNRVARLAGTLACRGFLTAQTDTGIFRIGPKVFALGRAFESSRLLLALARPRLRELALKTGESASLYGRDGFERVVLAREEGTHAIRHSIAEGQRMDLHAGAAGKVILAFSPPELVETILAKTGLPRRTSATITDKGRLLEELAAVRARGYAVSIGERAADACSVAAPIFESTNEMVGVLALSGPVSRFSPETRRAHIRRLLAAAGDLSQELGWKGGATRSASKTDIAGKRRKGAAADEKGNDTAA